MYPGTPLDILAARKALSALAAIDLCAATIEVIEQQLAPVLRGYTVETPRFNPGLRLYRSRISDRPSNIRDLLYPPAEVTPLGRCNKEKYPLLYCSTSRHAAYFESRPELGLTISVSEWRTTESLLVNHVGYVPSAFQRMGTNRANAGWSDKPAVIPQGMAEIATAIADLFTQSIPANEEYRYKLTAALAAKLIQGDLFGGLMYPTVAMSANADNLALKPSFVDTSLEFVRVELATIDRVRDFAYDVTIFDSACAASSEGTLEWRGRNDQWTLQSGSQLTLVEEDGGWVAYDQDGKLVPPD
jgi:hypothetical protein